MKKAEVWVGKVNEWKASLPRIYQMWIELWYNLGKDLTTIQGKLAAQESSGIESRLFSYNVEVRAALAGNP